MAAPEISRKIPVVDFSKKDIKPGTDAWLLATKQVCGALEEFGCFVALFDKLPLELDKAMFEAAAELFDLPSDIKKKNINDKPYHGYVGEVPVIPLHEGLGIDHATDPEKVRKFSEIMWSASNNSFCEMAHTYSTTVAELNQMVLRMMFENYGIDQKHYDSHLASTSYLLRFLKYKVPEVENQGTNAIPCHTDKTFLSILHQNDVNGLEVKTKEGEWIDFSLTPKSFVVMTGDACLGWSNDRIRACEHRVSLKGTMKTTRYTLGLFTFVNGMLSVPEELVDEQHPLKYKPFDNTGLVHFFAMYEGRRNEYSIRAYCGIETQ